MIDPKTLQPGSLTLLTGPKEFIRIEMHKLIVRSALLAPVRLLLGGNFFSLYDVAYALAVKTGNYENILEKHIHLSRGETCYQILEVLIETPTSPTLTLVTDFLSTFYDPGVPKNEIDQLLFESILEMKRLKAEAPIVVSARFKAIQPGLLPVLKSHADTIIDFNPQLMPTHPKQGVRL